MNPERITLPPPIIPMDEFRTRRVPRWASSERVVGDDNNTDAQSFTQIVLGDIPND